MTERERGGTSIEMLHRMISYIREEAQRLRVLDVALLLEHAEEAVTAFAPTVVGTHGRSAATHDATRVEH